MQQDEAIRAQVQTSTIEASAEIHLSRIPAELQAQKVEYRQTQQERNAMQSEKSGMEHRMTNMSNDVLLFGTDCRKRISRFRQIMGAFKKFLSILIMKHVGDLMNRKNEFHDLKVTRKEQIITKVGNQEIQG